MTEFKTVTNLKLKEREPVQIVIDMCERLLEKAKRGELRTIVYAGTLASGEFLTGHHTEDAIMTLGLMSISTHAIAALTRETATPEDY